MNCITAICFLLTIVGATRQPARRVGRVVKVAPRHSVIPKELLIQPTFDGCAANMDECSRVADITSLFECREAVEQVAGCDFTLKTLRAFIPPTNPYQCHSKYVWGVDLSALRGFSLMNDARIRGLWEPQCQDPIFAFSATTLSCSLNPETLIPSSLSKNSERGDLIIEFNGIDVSNTSRYLFTRPSCPLNNTVLDQLVLSLSLTTTPQNEGAPYETMLLNDSIDFNAIEDSAATKLWRLPLLAVVIYVNF